MVNGRAALALVIALLPATCAPSAAGELPWEEHPVRQGETLDSIAEQYPVDSNCIRRANELSGDIPPEGLTLLVPQSDGLLLETLAEVRARRRGETTADLYLEEDVASAARQGAAGPFEPSRKMCPQCPWKGECVLGREWTKGAL